jgi:pimeloyl-ACP methyl ester carboxylesterase
MNKPDSPRAHRVLANGIHHNILEWGEGERTVVMLHGYLDQAHSWGPVAETLAARGLRVLAADFRGHGETDWVPKGGYYHFPDYVLDLESWLTVMGVETFDLVGHSMGGTVATMYAGIRPKRVRTLVSVEGLGPPSATLGDVPDRFGRWIDGVVRVQKRNSKPIATLTEGLERLRVMHTTLPDELGMTLVARALKPHASGEGYAWRFDPLHQTQSPMPFRLEVYTGFLDRIAARTLVVLGEKGMRLADEAERIARIQHGRSVEIEGVGHMIHWHAPDRLAALIAEHVEGTTHTVSLRND